MSVVNSSSSPSVDVNSGLMIADDTSPLSNIGIDLNTALEILSQRSIQSQSDPHHVTNDDNQNFFATRGQQQNDLNGAFTSHCGCCQTIPNDLIGSVQGQCIDLAAPNNVAISEKSQTLENQSILHTSNDTQNEELFQKQQEQKLAQQRAIARQEELKNALQSMTLKEIIGAIFHTQEGRVRTYRFFDECLEYVLSTTNLEHYSIICADVTATFSVLSATINTIRSTLEQWQQETKGGDDDVLEVIKLLTRLQRTEQMKLQTTAALHLELVRQNALLSTHDNVIVNTTMMNGNTNNEINDQLSERKSQINDETIANLLEESILSLRKKGSVAIEEINDILEDLRYIMLEEHND